MVGDRRDTGIYPHRIRRSSRVDRRVAFSKRVPGAVVAPGQVTHEIDRPDLRSRATRDAENRAPMPHRRDPSRTPSAPRPDHSTTERPRRRGSDFQFGASERIGRTPIGAARERACGPPPDGRSALAGPAPAGPAAHRVADPPSRAAASPDPGRSPEQAASPTRATDVFEPAPRRSLRGGPRVSLPRGRPERQSAAPTSGASACSRSAARSSGSSSPIDSRISQFGAPPAAGPTLRSFDRSVQIARLS